METKDVYEKEKRMLVIYENTKALSDALMNYINVIDLDEAELKSIHNVDLEKFITMTKKLECADNLKHLLNIIRKEIFDDWVKYHSLMETLVDVSGAKKNIDKFKNEFISLFTIKMLVDKCVGILFNNGEKTYSMSDMVIVLNNISEDEADNWNNTMSFLEEELKINLMIVD